MAGKIRKHFLQLFQGAVQFFDLQAIKSIWFRALKLSIVNVAGLFLVFSVNYLIVQMVGEGAYGNYSILNVWVNFFVVIVIFGFDDLFIATIPKLGNSREGLYLLLQKALVISFTVFIAAALLVLLFVHLGFLPPVLGEYKSYFFVQMGVLSLLTLLLSFFRGLNVIVIGQVFDKIFRPSIFLLCILFYSFFENYLTLENILTFQVLSLLLPCLLLYMFLVKKLERKSFHAGDHSTPIKANFTFLGISLLYLLSTRLDIMFLSGQVAPQEVGYYNIAARIADIAGYPLMAINLIVHTLLAKEYQARKDSSIYFYVLRIAVLTFLTTAVIFLLIFLFGKSILGAFGERFVLSYTPLLILTSSHLLYSLTLPFNALLMVSNNERFSLLTLLVNVLVTFLLAYILVPKYAGKGAAFSILGGSCLYLLATSIVIYYLNLQNKVQRAMTSK